MMKIAIPTRSNRVDDHFGHCEYYTLYTISEENTVENSETYTAPAGCGCKSNIARILKKKGVTTMLAGNMGTGAVQKISSAGIDVYRGCSGNIDQVVDSYLKGEISDSGETCQHHYHGHHHKSQS